MEPVPGPMAPMALAIGTNGPFGPEELLKPMSWNHNSSIVAHSNTILKCRQIRNPPELTMPCNKTGVELCRSQLPLFNKMYRMSTRSLGRKASHFRRINSWAAGKRHRATMCFDPASPFHGLNPCLRKKSKKIKNPLIIPFRDRKQPPLMSFVSLKFLFRRDGS